MGTGGQYGGSCKAGNSSVVKHRYLLLLLNPKCSTSGQAQSHPTLGVMLAQLVDSIHSQ